MNLKDLTLGDLENIKTLLNPSAPVSALVDCACEIKTQIVILNRGWIVVGKVRQEVDQIHITSASVIRNWGTTRGLGEIAANGPTDSTKLDPCPSLSAHQLAVVARMDCDEKKWATHVK